jgi:hypothetical protein
LISRVYFGDRPLNSLGVGAGIVDRHQNPGITSDQQVKSRFAKKSQKNLGVLYWQDKLG